MHVMNGLEIQNNRITQISNPVNKPAHVVQTQKHNIIKLSVSAKFEKFIFVILPVCHCEQNSLDDNNVNGYKLFKYVHPSQSRTIFRDATHFHIDVTWDGN